MFILEIFNAFFRQVTVEDVLREIELDWPHMLGAVLLIVVAGLALCVSSFWSVGSFWLGAITVILVDLYLCLLLGWSSLSMSQKLPNRVVAFPILALIFFTLVLAFASVHLSLNELRNFKQEGLPGVTDALYFSAVTITTLGDGRFDPIGWRGQLAIVAEVLSGLLLLIGAIPLLIGSLTVQPEKGTGNPPEAH